MRSTLAQIHKEHSLLHRTGHQGLCFHHLGDRASASLAQPGVPVYSSSVQLHTYSGKPLKVAKGTSVDVVFGQQQASLPLFVVTGREPCLMRGD